MDTVPRSLTVRAPAKINLGLEVLRRRQDGFHEINTVFATVGVEDTLLLVNNGSGTIECSVEGNSALAAEPDNLVLRAARIVRERWGEEAHGVSITLRKEIPAGAGLGGGSSDAAATLLALRALWNLPVEGAELLEIAATLGSDVPFFIGGGLALGGGRGEVLAPLSINLPPWWVVLVNPGIHIPTPWAFRALGREEERAPSDLASALALGAENPATLRAALVNDFERPVFAEHPAIGGIKERLYSQGALLALMSGSGSTVFGLFTEQEEAERAAGSFGEYWCHTAQLLPDRARG